MTAFSEDIQATVLEILTDLGSDVSVTRYENVYNPNTGGSYGSAINSSTNGDTFVVGEDEIILSAAGTGSINVGDMITFESHATQYEVAVGLDDVSAGGTITLTSGLTQEINTEEVITLVNRSSETSYTAKVVTDSYNNFEIALSLLARTSNQSLVKGTDKKLYVAYSATYIPAVGDVYDYRGTDYRIADVKTYDLQQDTFIYEVRLEI